MLLLDRGGRIKPCGGAIPPRLIEDFDIPGHLLAARITGPPEWWRRQRGRSTCRSTVALLAWWTGNCSTNGCAPAPPAMAPRGARAGSSGIARDADGMAVVNFHRKGAAKSAPPEQVRARVVIGADGAKSLVAAQCIPGAERVTHVFAYHEIVRAPVSGFDGTRCDVYYQGRLSPDFYGWVFPHGDTASVGVGSARKGFALRQSVTTLRDAAGLGDVETVRREGAPIPLRPLRRWDNGRDVILAGDAAGVVAPASGEGIYYAMEGGRLAAEAAGEFLAGGDARKLRLARRRFMRAHGRVFWILRVMQWFWYSSDGRRERFVSICRDPDVQRLTWEFLHEQASDPRKPDGAYADFLQGPGASSGFGAGVRADIVVPVLWGILVAGTGAWLTDLSPWYHELKKPSWQPPDWLFGPAWTVILALASLSAWFAWRNAQDQRHRLLVVGLFCANGVLNVLWSPLFFLLRRPDWALLEVPVLWLSILAPIVLLAPISTTASLLLVPYLLWVSFAAVLNLTIVRLNRPFGG